MRDAHSHFMFHVFHFRYILNMVLNGVTRLPGKFLNKNLLFYLAKNRPASTLTKDEKEKRQKEMMARGLPKKNPIPGVKHIILVASGKGGVGKSTVAVNIALGLKLLNPTSEIGLLDADVFGPTVPLMMNLHESPYLTPENLMKPLINYGVKCMSMGFLIGEKTGTVIWRGLMVMNAVEKLLRGTAWAPLDVLIVDTPPGTGDTHLSLAQLAPITGAVLVTTPQIAAIQVTHKGATMFAKLGIPVIGLVHNMAWTHCPSCHAKVYSYGPDAGVKQLASEVGTNVLEEIPMDNALLELNESGKPIVISQPESVSALAFKNIAIKVNSFIENVPGDWKDDK